MGTGALRELSRQGFAEQAGSQEGTQAFIESFSALRRRTSQAKVELFPSLRSRPRASSGDHKQAEQRRMRILRGVACAGPT